MGCAAGGRGEASEDGPLAAADVQDRRLGRQRQAGRGLGEGREERVEEAGCEEPAPREGRLLRVAGRPRAAVLRLEEVYVAAPREIEGMPARAAEGALAPRQRLAAAADGAAEGDLPQNAPVSATLARLPLAFRYILTAPVWASVTVSVYSTEERAP
jgi:hypothetical protein